MTFEKETWVVEKNPLGPPADPKKVTPLGSSLNGLEERIESAFASQDARALQMPSLRVPPRAAKTILQQFQSGHGYTKTGVGTLSDDAADFVVGTQSMKFVTDGAGGTGSVEKKSIGPIDFTAKDVYVKFKVSSIDDVSDFSIYLSSDNAAENNVHYPIALASQPYVASEEWAHVIINWGDLAANGAVKTIDRSKVNYIRFRMVDKNGKAVTFHVNEVAAVPQPSVAQLNIWIDDGWESTYTMARPVLQKYDFRAGVAIIRDVIGSANYMSLAQMKSLWLDNGWPLVCHADTVVNHNKGFKSISDAAAEAEFQGIKRFLIEHGGGKGRDAFVWPRGEFTASQLLIARKYFSAIRGTCGGKGGAGGAHETFPPADPGRLRTWIVGSSVTAAEVEAACAQAIANKTALSLSYHRILTSGASGGTEINKSVFEEHMAKVAASGIAVKTPTEMLES